MDLMQRFAHLLSTNDSPQPAELASIVEEVARMKDAIVKRRLELEKLESDRRALESLLAPLRRASLPPETLGEVFGRVLEDCGPASISDRLCTICLVCKIWRDAALATPCLWDHLAIELHERCCHERVEKWLARAGGLPRRVSVRTVSAADRCPNKCPFGNLDLTRLLTQDSIQDLSLGCDYMVCLENVFQAAKSFEMSSFRPWNSLKSLRLDAWDWTPVDNLEAKIDFPQHLPRSLVSLSLNLPSFYFTNASEDVASLCLPNLKDLEVTFESATWILKSLNGTPNLDRLSLNFASNGSLYDFQDKTKCTLPRLQSLRLQGLLNAEEDTDILDEMTCPNLAELDISFWGVGTQDRALGSDEAGECFSPHILKFVDRSNCSGTLSRLRLHSFTILSSILISVFRGVHSVENLVLDDVYIKGRPFQDITDEGLLPQLEILELRNIWHRKTHYNSLYRFIKSRHRGSRSLTQPEDVSSIPGLLKKVIITINPEEDERPPSLDSIRLTLSMRELGVVIVKSQSLLGEVSPWSR